MQLKDEGEIKTTSDKTLARKFSTSDGMQHLIVVNLQTTGEARRVRIDDTFGTHDLLAGGGKLISLAK